MRWMDPLVQRWIRRSKALECGGLTLRHLGPGGMEKVCVQGVAYPHLRSPHRNAKPTTMRPSPRIQ